MNLKFDTTDSKIFFTSDTHFNHDKEFIYKARGFQNVEDHNYALIDSINKSVGEYDKIFHLGDFCLNTNRQQLDDFLDRIICRNIYYIWGNHNNPLRSVYREQILNGMEVHGQYAQALEAYPIRYRNVVFLGDYVELDIKHENRRRKFVACHYPIISYNGMNRNTSHICGHSHYSYEISRADNNEMRILDVGWDGHGRVLTVDDLVGIFRQKNSNSVDHHVYE